MRKALDAADVSGKEMAAYLGVNPAQVSRWINGKQRPTRQTKLLWALRTGVPIEYIETGILPNDPDGDDGVHPPGLEPGTHWLRDNVIPGPWLDEAKPQRLYGT